MTINIASKFQYSICFKHLICSRNFQLTVRLLPRLTIPELLRLFGDVNEDANGDPFILVNNRDTRPNPNGDMEDEGYDDD